ncbi:MAG: glycosyltransferase family 2 protein [Proteobacteria bacterium]|nr:glycosyltransferase family 2 protein [Pseudomonadota bacterium]
MSEAISVVVPAYRSAATLPLLHARMAAWAEHSGQSFELVVVDDASDDGTWATIDALAAKDPRVRGIRLRRNAGQHNALLCGIRAARSPLVVTLDDDLQNPPEEISRLREAMNDNLDVVYGVPDRERHGLLRNLASRITKLALSHAMGSKVARNVSAFRLFRTDLRDAFSAFSGPHANIDVLLTWGTTRFGSVVVRHDERAAGTSAYTFGRLLNHAFNMITGFSALPLQLASVAGIAFGLLGFAILAFVMGRYLMFGSSVPGFTFLASLVAILSGVQLLAIGIFGEYLARVHFRSMQRPTYSVLERTAHE